jgi:F-type H+-transporting ATPase subunit gamma
MPTLLDFRRRIRSVKNTQQITRAMKFIAAARLRRAQETALSLRPYASGLREVLRSAMSRIENPEQFPLLAQRPEEKILVLVTSGERGLAGAFNANVLRTAFEFLRDKKDKSIEVITIAKKGRDAFRKRSYKIVAEYVDVTSRADLGKAREIAAEVMKIYTSGGADSVYLIYNEFKNVMTQTLRVEKVLPLERAALHDQQEKTKDAPPSSSASEPVDYIYEQPAEEIFNKLVPRYVEMQIFRMISESSAAEHAARMTAMESATSNASDVIDALTLHMNKVRQAAITREIIEVVSGAASAG